MGCHFWSPETANTHRAIPTSTPFDARCRLHRLPSFLFMAEVNFFTLSIPEPRRDEPLGRTGHPCQRLFGQCSEETLSLRRKAGGKVSRDFEIHATHRLMFKYIHQPQCCTQWAVSRGVRAGFDCDAIRKRPMRWPLPPSVCLLPCRSVGIRWFMHQEVAEYGRLTLPLSAIRRFNDRGCRVEQKSSSIQGILQKLIQQMDG